MPYAEAAMYEGFAQVEYEFVRAVAYPTFEWAQFDVPSPRNRLTGPVSSARVALVSSGGAHLPDQPSFSLRLSGDHSCREIPRNTGEVVLSHTYDVTEARTDPDVVFPLALLRRLAADGFIGEVAPTAFSFMGYIPAHDRLLDEAGPELARRLTAADVDLALLVPA
jgi:D-proline reductase (dithiol) PrdB